MHGALLGLGYSVREADDAVLAVAGDADAMVVAGDAPDVGSVAAPGAALARRGPGMTDQSPAQARADELEVVDAIDLADGVDLVDPRSDVEDRLVDAALRPRNLGEFVGQERVREQLSLILDGARAPGPAGRPRAAVRVSRVSARRPWP